MKPIFKPGFTIVEVMLFLGVSGLMFIGIMVGTGAAINVQRYRDSVVSLQSLLQQQFFEVTSVSNDRSNGDMPCDSVEAPIGQSKCEILGRYIVTKGDNSDSLEIKNVVGLINADADMPSNDVEALQAYNLSVSTVGAQTYQIEWGASLDNYDGTVKKFSMMIVRSPSSGVVRTFLSDGSSPITDTHLGEFLTSAESLSNPVVMCVNSDGLFSGSKLAVKINANASSSSGISVIGEEVQNALAEDKQCH